jgi:hypothetical protein
MITYWIIYFLATALLGFLYPLTFLPDATLPAAVSSGITGIAGFIGLVWRFFPLTFAALIGAVAVIVAVENYVLIYKVIRWVYQKIPGVS